LRWDEELDLSIIKILDENNELHYNGLYKLVCSTYRTISPETFSIHIKKLDDSGYIDKFSNGIGKKSRLSLTDKARRQVRMKTLDFKSKKERANSKGISNKQLCVLLLLFRRPTIYKFDTETGFDNFLSQFKLTRQQLIQTRYPKFVSVDRKYYFKDTAWSSPSDDINITREDIRHRIDASGKYHRVMQPEFYYYCTVKGLTEREIIKTDIRLPSSFFKVTKAQAKKVFNILRKEKLLKPIAKYNDEFIYAISDKRFDNFLQDCLEVYQSISDLIIGVWDSIRPPRSEEIQWLEFFIGKKGTDQVRIRADERRKAKHGMTTDEFREWLKWWKNALKSDYDVKNMVKDLIKKHKLTIEKYPYSNEILNHVCPNFLEDILQFN